jgi:hypothetical protein
MIRPMATSCEFQFAPAPAVEAPQPSWDGNRYTQVPRRLAADAIVYFHVAVLGPFGAAIEIGDHLSGLLTLKLVPQSYTAKKRDMVDTPSS